MWRRHIDPHMVSSHDFLYYKYQTIVGVFPMADELVFMHYYLMILCTSGFTFGMINFIGIWKMIIATYPSLNILHNNFTSLKSPVLQQSIPFCYPNSPVARNHSSYCSLWVCLWQGVLTQTWHSPSRLKIFHISFWEDIPFLCSQNNNQFHRYTIVDSFNHRRMFCLFGGFV